MKTRIDYLLKQYFYNRSTREELDELFNIIRSEEYDGELSHYIRKQYDTLKREETSTSYINEDGDLAQMGEILEPSVRPIRPTHAANTKRANKRGQRILIVAASIALLLIGFYYGQRFVELEPVSSVQVIKRVAPDERKVIYLSDGTKVWVNASSTLEYPQHFAKGEPREVTLYGEAYFEVERAADWPFIVHTGDIQTKVLGTKFNIKAYSEMADVLVSVRSGKVQVSRYEQVVATLLPNQEVSVSHTVENVISPRVEKQLKTKIVGSWTQGYLEYEDEPITSIVADVERAYGITIDWRDSASADKVVTLSVPSKSKPDYILEVLTTLTDTQVRKEEENYIIF